MPGMDGLTLIGKLNDINPLIKAVIISAYGDMSNIRIAMNRGAFDFLYKPVNFDDIDTTIQKIIRYVKQLKESVEAIRENNILKMYVDETVFNFMSSHEMISGNIGSANLKRLDDTIISDTVNTSQRLQGVAKAGEILISEESYKKVKGSFHCEKIGEVVLKHKKNPVVIYLMLG